MKVLILQRGLYYTQSKPLAYIDDKAFSMLDYSLDEKTQNDIIFKIVNALIPLEKCSSETTPIYISRITQQAHHQFSALITDGSTVSYQSATITDQLPPTGTRIVIRSLEPLEQAEIRAQLRISDAQEHASFVSIIDSYISNLQHRHKKESEKFLASKRGQNVVEPILPEQPIPPIITTSDHFDLQLAYDYFNNAKTTLQKLKDTLKEHREIIHADATQQLSTLESRISQTPNLNSPGYTRLSAYTKQVYLKTKQDIEKSVETCIQSSDLSQQITCFEPLIKQKYQIAKAKIQILNYYKSLLIHAIYKAASIYYVHLQKTEDVERSKIIDSVNKFFKGCVTVSSNGILHPLDYDILMNQSLDDLTLFTCELLKSCDTSVIGNSDKSLSIKQAFNDIPLIENQPLFEFQTKKPYQFKWCDLAYNLEEDIVKNKFATEEALEVIASPDKTLLLKEAESAHTSVEEIIHGHEAVLKDYSEKFALAFDLMIKLKESIASMTQIKQGIENILILSPMLSVHTRLSFTDVCNSLEQAKSTCDQLYQQLITTPQLSADQSQALIALTSNAHLLAAKIELTQKNLHQLLKDHQSAYQQELEKERLEKERLEKERLEKERLEAERLERDRLENARLEKERLEAERLERDRLENARLEKEQLTPRIVSRDPRPPNPTSNIQRNRTPQTESDTTPLLEPASKSSPSFLSRHGGKLFGSLGGAILGAIGGGIAGAFLAPFTLGISIPVGALIGFFAGGGFGLVSGTIIDSCCCKPQDPDDEPGNDHGSVTQPTTSGIYNRLDATPSRRQPTSPLATRPINTTDPQTTISHRPSQSRQRNAGNNRTDKLQSRVIY